MKTISLIIPVYNVEAYLPRCLDSVLQNSYPDLEIICVNDGSTDHSAAILAQYAEKDARIRVIHQENQGVSAARNAGLEAATGELISFLDGDDWLHPQFFRIMLHYLERWDGDVVICERHHTYPGDPITPAKIHNLESLDYKILSGRTMMQDHTAKAFVWGRLFKRKLLDGLNFSAGLTLGEDRVFNLSLACKYPDMRIVRLSQGLYYYFFREDSAVNTATQDNWIALAGEILRRCEETGEQQSKQLYLTEAFKLTFSARAACGVDSGKIHCLLEGCLAELKHTPTLPMIRKAGYRIMVQFPLIYRLLRIPKTMAAARKTNKRRQTR